MDQQTGILHKYSHVESANSSQDTVYLKDGTNLEQIGSGA